MVGSPMIWLRVISLVIVCLMAPALAWSETASELSAKALDLVSPARETRKAAISFFANRGKPDAIPALILADRFATDDRDLQGTLESLSGAKAQSWFDWMVWQEAHPEVAPFTGFDEFQAKLYRAIDSNFGLFMKPGAAHQIRLEEIAWGGVIKDGIPALTDPRLLDAANAHYLAADDLVFGLEINGDARAYPLRIMDWHEMFNDVVGGVPVSLAYCTLCGSGILYETSVPGRSKPFVFGSSGLLYRSNKLMYDTETNSLWNQFAGRPVAGPLTGSGITLRTRPVVITTWADWRRLHPATRVLDIETGFQRDYRPGAPYGYYFASPDLMFPTQVGKATRRPKDFVFALRSAGAERAWPLALFAGGAVLNDKAGIADVVLIGDAATRTVRAYRTDGRTFTKGTEPEHPLADGAPWQLTEDSLNGPGGKTFLRLPGHIAYWFAWSGSFGLQGTVAGEPDAGQR